MGSSAPSADAATLRHSKAAVTAACRNAGSLGRISESFAPITSELADHELHRGVEGQIGLPLVAGVNSASSDRLAPVLPEGGAEMEAEWLEKEVIDIPWDEEVAERVGSLESLLWLPDLDDISAEDET